VLLYATPFSSVPVPVIVIVFPSCEMTRVVVAVTLPPLFVARDSGAIPTGVANRPRRRPLYG